MFALSMIEQTSQKSSALPEATGPMNPLLQYKVVTGQTWREVAERAKMGVAQVHKIAKQSPDKLQNFGLITHIKLKRRLGVDILAWVEADTILMSDAKDTEKTY